MTPMKTKNDSNKSSSYADDVDPIRMGLESARLHLVWRAWRQSNYVRIRSYACVSRPICGYVGLYTTSYRLGTRACEPSCRRAGLKATWVSMQDARADLLPGGQHLLGPQTLRHGDKASYSNSPERKTATRPSKERASIHMPAIARPAQQNHKSKASELLPELPLSSQRPPTTIAT